ncbi:MAG: hypothetical protein SPJ81_09315, partial [Lachnoclostridium sp.]|nr:hypothetical protein [Lachnoclostridium sp.]
KVEMSLHGGTEIGDIAMLTWSYEDPACKGVWMRAEEMNGKYDYMTGLWQHAVLEQLPRWIK